MHQQAGLGDQAHIPISSFSVNAGAYDFAALMAIAIMGTNPTCSFSIWRDRPIQSIPCLSENTQNAFPFYHSNFLIDPTRARFSPSLTVKHKSRRFGLAGWSVLLQRRSWGLND